LRRGRHAAHKVVTGHLALPIIHLNLTIPVKVGAAIFIFGGAMGKLDGQVAVVTGASHGLGRAIALGLAREGCGVALAARSAEPLYALAAEIAAAGGSSLVVTTDLRDEPQIIALFEAALAHFGHLDILVNNAALLGGAPIDELSTELWLEAVAVNLTAPFICTREAFRAMKHQGRGRIINIASISSQRVRPNSAPYSATKHGLWGLTQVTALEGRAHGIVASCIYPGNIRTETRATPDSDFNREPMMTVDEVAAGVVFMAAQPPHLNVLEMTMLPVEQAFLGRG
jgi:NAD(P)-dependent dehydrogenase (short-subunit alcohol dehydrogenase family)